jgi:hypothetical protein
MSTETQKVDVRAELLRQGVTGKVIEAVAELIEATEFLSAELLRKYGGTAAVGETRVRAALARVGGAA